MEDKQIVDLYWARSETAISETQTKYGKYCHYIAQRILESFQDAEECVNDTYVKAWNAMPPHRPERLQTFLGKITRRLALDRYDYNTAQKRNCSMQLALEELAECIPGGSNEDTRVEEAVLRDAINEFLGNLTKKNRILFVRRYWYLCSVKELAESMGMSESNVKVTLLRTRNRFKEHLENEGIVV